MVDKRKYPNLYLGLSGVVLPIPKYRFPAQFQNASRLTYYATFFNSLEVNSTFYALPQKRTVEKWSASVPEDFQFTFKLSREITHQKELFYDRKLIFDFFEVIERVGGKNACVLVQFPPGCKSSKFSEVEKLLEDLSAANKDARWNIAVEFRDPGWYSDEVLDTLKSANASLVIQDIPKSASPFVTTSEKFVYVRFHGPTGNYRGSYSDDFLQEYASYIHEWLNEGKFVYVYFNNTAGSAFENLRTLQTFLEL
jgi:uncharacterized protein YecE (DUF72 family)